MEASKKILNLCLKESKFGGEVVVCCLPKGHPGKHRFQERMTNPKMFGSRVYDFPIEWEDEQGGNNEKV